MPLLLYPFRRVRALFRVIRDLYHFLIVRDPNKVQKDRHERGVAALEAVIEWYGVNASRFVIAALGFVNVLLLYGNPSGSVLLVAGGVGVLVGVVIGVLMMFSHMQGAKLDADLKRLSLTNDGLHDFVITGETPAVVLTQESFWRRVLEHFGAR